DHGDRDRPVQRPGEDVAHDDVVAGDEYDGQDDDPGQCPQPLGDGAQRAECGEHQASFTRASARSASSSSPTLDFHQSTTALVASRNASVWASSRSMISIEEPSTSGRYSSSYTWNWMSVPSWA